MIELGVTSIISFGGGALLKATHVVTANWPLTLIGTALVAVVLALLIELIRARQLNNRKKPTPMARMTTLLGQTLDPVSLSLEPVDYSTGFVHLKVTNNGPPDTFVVQVVEVYGSADKQVQYAAKWRDVTTAEKTVYKDDLIDLAQLTNPTATIPPKPPRAMDEIGKDYPEPDDPTFSLPCIKLFSTTLPDGWHANPQFPYVISDLMKTARERAKDVCDCSITLVVRVTGASGQTETARVRLGFERPKWSPQMGFYLFGTPTAAIDESLYQSKRLLGGR